MFDPKFVEACRQFAVSVGLPGLILLLLLAKDYMFTSSIVSNNTRTIEILQTMQRDGIKCKHD